MAKAKKITASSTAEYFAKNLQQVGFSSPVKAVLTTLKEALDNALDACEEHEILPEIEIVISKLGKGSLKNTDRILVSVTDNGPGIDLENVPLVFGQYLASSKFGRGRCSRGQQGIGISAATTWALQTSAQGAKVITKTKGQKKALSCFVVSDFKKNQGMMKNKTMIPWDKTHGTHVEFVFDGRLQLNGEAGLLAFLRGNILLNPHMSLTYSLPDMKPVVIKRVSNITPKVPEATLPHPHTMKLGEFIAHAGSFGRIKVRDFLTKTFSRVTDSVIKQLEKKGHKTLMGKTLTGASTEDYKNLYATIQDLELKAPSTQSVMAIGEDALSLSILRLGEVNYFAVESRKPMICDYKPVQVEVAIARLKQGQGDAEGPVQILRFANRVPLQFDKSACAIVKSIVSVNWKAYGLKQSRAALPTGSYIIAVSVVSPFIKFKNASKETIDASDELVDEIRKALMKAGNKLSRHLRKETKEKELEQKTQHIEKFCPILVETLCRILDVPKKRKESAMLGLRKILERENSLTKKELEIASEKLGQQKDKRKESFSLFSAEDELLMNQESES